MTLIRSAGGKTQHLPHLIPLVEAAYAAGARHYLELFVGGGALFFAIGNPSAPHVPRDLTSTISDLDKDLMALYAAARDDHQALFTRTAALLALITSPETYLELRRRWNDDLRHLPRQLPDGRTDIERIAAYWALRRTAFNGLWRVNRTGDMNVPWCKAIRYPAAETFDVTRSFLRGVTIAAADFRHFALALPDPGRSVIFLDPPYLGGFTAYGADPWTFDDFAELLRTAALWVELGAKIILTHSVDPLGRELIERTLPDAHIQVVSARRAINCDSTKRDGASELIVAAGYTPAELPDRLTGRPKAERQATPVDG